MWKRIIFSILVFSSCNSQNLDLFGIKVPLSQDKIAEGLKQSLDLGTKEAIDFLGRENGFYHTAFKIQLPDEMKSVTSKLKVIPGFQNAEEELLKLMNHAAENAVSTAMPIFVNAVKEMTINEALNILMGQNNAATTYLKDHTRNQLYNGFQPLVYESLNQFKVNEYWSKLANKYNKLPFVKPVNTQIDDYVTNQSLDGMFKLIEKKEEKIRSSVSERTTKVLRDVFARQDVK